MTSVFLSLFLCVELFGRMRNASTIVIEVEWKWIENELRETQSKYVCRMISSVKRCFDLHWLSLSKLNENELSRNICHVVSSDKMSISSVKMFWFLRKEHSVFCNFINQLKIELKFSLKTRYVVYCFNRNLILEVFECWEMVDWLVFFGVVSNYC